MILTNLLPLLVGTSLASAFGQVAAEPEGDQSVGDVMLKWLELSQSQVAALLGVTPQAVSKALKEEGIDFFEKERRAQRLYRAMSHIGGDRYLLSAARMKEVSSQLGWGTLDEGSSNTISPGELYETADEVWVVSDEPGKMIDWSALKKTLFAEHKGPRDKVWTFFLSTLEGAKNWAEVLEREAINLATHDHQVHQDKVVAYSAYVYLVVTNITSFSGNFLITNPGSRCMGTFHSTKPPAMYYWNAGSYIGTDYAAHAFVGTVQRHEIGMNTVKANFFPTGQKLSREVIYFHTEFIDGLIARRGKKFIEDDAAGSSMAGGILRATPKNPEDENDPTNIFNKNAKFCPVFILTYKRKPGDYFSKKSLKIVQEEQDRQQREEVAPPREVNTFW